MATLYEKHNTGDDTAYSIAMTSGDAQTFTPSVSHTITSVKLKLYRAATAPGTITVSIRAVDTDTGLPTGDDLCSGTTSGNTLTQVTSGEWREIDLGAGTDLSAGTAYAIYAWSAAIEAFWRTDTNNGYADGKQCTTADGGTTWLDISGGLYDLMFEEWGGVPTGGTDPPTVSTQECTNVVAQSATGQGTISDLGGAAVTQHGHCWATTSSPTTSNSKTTNGAAPNAGQFTSSITGLTPGTKYYVRAYATNSWGTSYGANVEIAGSVTTIGRRHWWVEGKEFHYFDAYGDERKIEGVPDTSGLPWWWYF